MAELQRAQDLVKQNHKHIWLAGNDMTFEGDWNWAKGSLDDDWDTFLNEGGPMGLEFAWVLGSPHRHEHEDCLVMTSSGKFEDYPCDHDKYILCDDGTD